MKLLRPSKTQNYTLVQSRTNLFLTLSKLFKTMRKKQSKTLKKLKRTHNILCEFLKSTNKNYLTMKQKIKRVWAGSICLLIMTIAMSCNVTRTIKTESSYFQKGDTTCTITVKTVETYDATKKGL